MEELAEGRYTVELSGPDPISFRDCLIHFTPFTLEVTVGPAVVGDWALAAELAVSDSWEVLNIFSNANSVVDAVIECCDVVTEGCPGGQPCSQCWDATSTPVFNAEWTGDGFPWLMMSIEPTVGEVRKKGVGTNPALAQYELLEFGEVCVQGSIGPVGEEPARVVEVCRTIDRSRPAEIEGRTRVDVDSCRVTPDVAEGTRGLLVIRAESEQAARDLVEASPYSVGAGFVPRVATEPAGVPAEGEASVEPTTNGDGVTPPSTGDRDAAVPSVRRADPQLHTMAPAEVPPPPSDSGCSTGSPVPAPAGAWLWLLAAVCAVRRARSR